MKLGEVFEGLEKFFLDVNGYVLPGATTLIGLWLVLGAPTVVGLGGEELLSNGFMWFVVVAGGYALGHGIIAVGEYVVLPISDRVARLLLRLRPGREGTAWFVPRDRVEQRVMGSVEFAAFVELARRRTSFLRPPVPEGEGASRDFHSWRNLAMSEAPDGTHLVYRFMFVSLLNLGLATSLGLLAATWAALGAARAYGIAAIPTHWNWLILGLLVASVFFLARRYEFYQRTLQVPFSMAVAKLAESRSEKLGKAELTRGGRRPSERGPLGVRKQRIYLAGGFRSDWQERVKDRLPQLSFADPSSHDLEGEDEYTVWDLEAIGHCDWVFAYLEENNPGGYSLALEVGYAKASGKLIILVDEKSPADESARRYLVMLTACADVCFESLDEGIEYLTTLQTAV